MASAAHHFPGIESSPYRVRGLIYLGTRSFFDKRVAGGYSALLAALPEPLRSFMSQDFHPREFYEVMVVPELVEMEARIAGLSIARYLDQRARFQAVRDLSGAAAWLIRLLPAGIGISQVAARMTDTFNFGESHVSKVGPRQYHVQIRDVPQRLCAWLEHSVGVYGQTCLEVAGEKGVEVRSLPPDRGHQAMVHLNVEARWQS